MRRLVVRSSTVPCPERRRGLLVCVGLIVAIIAIVAIQVSANTTGRWKWSGTACYWDANDTGPDQCDPNNPPSPTPMELNISGTSFVVENQTRFLVFVSMFDALRESDANLASDFQYLHNKGVNGIRIFPNWWRRTADYGSGTVYYPQDSLMDPQGNLRSAPLTKLLNVLTLAKQNELFVDLSFSAETVAHCPDDNCIQPPPDVSSLTYDELKTGLVALSTILSNGGSAYKHAFLDLQNECNKEGNGPSDKRPFFVNYTDEIRSIVQAIHAVDWHIIVTASFAGFMPPGDAAWHTADKWLDVTTWHQTRQNHWWTYTASQLPALLGAGKPVYLQEPAPFPDYQWTTAGVLDDVLAARSAGAAAWCFHTRSSFHLSDGSLYGHLTTDEKAVLDGLIAKLRDQ
jgi:hypothetical protein